MERGLDVLVFERRLRSVDKRGVDGEAVELRGYLLQYHQRRIGGTWLQELIGLHVECREDGRKQTSLL